MSHKFQDIPLFFEINIHFLEYPAVEIFKSKHSLSLPIIPKKSCPALAAGKSEKMRRECPDESLYAWMDFLSAVSIFSGAGDKKSKCYETFLSFVQTPPKFKSARKTKIHQRYARNRYDHRGLATESFIVSYATMIIAGK